MIGLRKKTLSGGLWKGRTTGPTFPRVQLDLSYLVLPFQIYRNVSFGFQFLFLLFLGAQYLRNQGFILERYLTMCCFP